jgi:hypothetical protein
MKRYTFMSLIFLGLLGICFVANNAMAGSARLTWTANTEPDLNGYKIYYATSSHAGTCPTGYTSSVNVSDDANTGYWFDALTPGQTYYFQVTALDTSANESDCSTSPGEVSKLITYRGDINASPDHNVNINDFTIFAASYGNTSYCGTPTTNKPDINRDCTVNINDFTILAAEYGLSF